MSLGFIGSGRTVVPTVVLALLLGGIATPASAVTISSTVTFFDAGAPSSFGFEFSPPVSLSGPTIVSFTVSGTLSDFAGDGVSMTPFPNSDSDGDGIPEVFSAFAGLGGSSVRLLDLGPASSTAGVYGPFSVGPIAGPTGPFDQIALAMYFTASGGNDSYTLTATLTVEQGTLSVPWGTSLGLIAGGIGTVFARRRLR